MYPTRSTPRSILLACLVASAGAAGCADESYGGAELAVPGRPVEVVSARDSTAWLGMPVDLDVRGATLVIADVFRHTVHLIDRETGAWRALGGEGTGPGEFQMPAAVSFVGDELWVTDSGTHRLTRFTADGAFLETTPLRMPLTVAVDDAGRPLCQSADAAYLVEAAGPGGPVPLGEVASLPPALREQIPEDRRRWNPNLVLLEPLGRGEFVVAENETGTLWVASISGGALELGEIELPPRLRRELREQKENFDAMFEGSWAPVYQSVHAADSVRVWLRTNSAVHWGFLANTRTRRVELLVRVNPDERIPMIDSLVRGDTLFILTDDGVLGRLIDSGR